MSSASTAPNGPDPVPLEDVIITHELKRRPTRRRDPEAENRALYALAARLHASPLEALQTLLDQALALCGLESRGSAGVSMVEVSPSTGRTIFRWTALAGRMANEVGGWSERDASPCSVCLERDEPVLFARPERHFTRFRARLGEPAVEALVLPFPVGDRTAGTIWLVSHDEGPAFDGEDVRLMSGLAAVTGAVYALLESRAEAGQASRARREIVEMISHDLRTPLAAIGNYAAALERGARGPLTLEQRRDVGRIRANQRQVIALLDDLLEAMREDEGRLEFTIRDISVREVLTEVHGTLGPMARECQIGLSWDLPEAPPLTVRADRDRLQQVLLNLLHNAVKFTEPGGRVEVVGRRAGDQAAIAVRDTGIGIPADRLSDIFQPFVRLGGDVAPAPTAAESARRGSGLGLAICRKLVHAMSGRITVESVPDEGSTFTVFLPAPPPSTRSEPGSAGRRRRSEVRRLEKGRRVGEAGRMRAPTPDRAAAAPPPYDA